MCIGSNMATYCWQPTLVVFIFPLLHFSKANIYPIVAMKHCIAAVYTNYTTTLIETPDMELEEGYTAGPRIKKLVLKF